MGATHPHFTRQFNKDSRKLECEKSQKHYENSAVFRKVPHLHTLEIPQGETTATTLDSSFTAAMDYAAAHQVRFTLPQHHQDQDSTK